MAGLAKKLSVWRMQQVLFMYRNQFGAGTDPVEVPDVQVLRRVACDIFDYLHSYALVKVPDFIVEAREEWNASD